MQNALVYNNSVETIFTGTLPLPYTLKDGTKITSHDGLQGAAILPAVYVDTPTPGAMQAGETYEITADEVKVTRIWQGMTRDQYDNLVNAERDRRISLGITIEVSPGKNIPVDTRDSDDLRNVQGLATIAYARIAAADSTPIAFRGADNVTYSLTPQEVWKLANGEGVAGRVAYLYAKAWALKDAAEMVADIAADEHWA